MLLSMPASQRSASGAAGNSTLIGDGPATGWNDHLKPTAAAEGRYALSVSERRPGGKQSNA